MSRIKATKGVAGSPQVPAAKVEVVKLKLTVDRETARQLRVEAFGRQCSLGELVADLLRSSPRRFVLQERGSKASGGSQETPGPRVLGVVGSVEVEGPPGGPGASGVGRPGGVVGLGGVSGSSGSSAAG